MFLFRPNFIPNKILIVGCGGTGSRLVPLLAQFVRTCSWVIDPEITLVDDDVVEEKNLLRQNFITPDVGKPKAEVLAYRYSKAFNVPITFHKRRLICGPEYNKLPLEDRHEIEQILYKNLNNAIIILCVDSVKARQDIVELIHKYTGNVGNVLLLDSGNENDFGQVSISSLATPDLNVYEEYMKNFPKRIPGDIDIPFIPLDISYFRDMVSTSNTSCADLDQTMAINTMMAVTMFGIIQNIYYAKPISYHRIDVSLSHGSTPHYMNIDFINKCVKSAEDGFRGKTLKWSRGFAEVLSNFYYDVFLPLQQEIDRAEKLSKANAIADAKKVAKIVEDNELDNLDTEVAGVATPVVGGIEADLSEVFWEESADTEQGVPVPEVGIPTTVISGITINPGTMEGTITGNIPPLVMPNQEVLIPVSSIASRGFAVEDSIVPRAVRAG